MDGFYVINKPSGYTSRDIVNIAGRIFGTRRIGHAGTLDPIATGVLVLAVGNGLKALEFVSSDIKEYIATVKIGISTNTLDITGEIEKKVDNYYLDLAKLDSAIKSFIGKYEQEVPLFSSVRVDGQRLYKYAREKKNVELPKREVEIYNIELLEHNHNEFKIKVLVSKGTYIRSLIRDIGDKIGIPCTMKELVRTRQGDFSLDESVTLEQFENSRLEPLSIEKGLKNIYFVEADDYLENRILNGSILRNLYDKDIVGFKNKDGVVLALYEVYEKDNSKIKPIKVFKKEI